MAEKTRKFKSKSAPTKDNKRSKRAEEKVLKDDGFAAIYLHKIAKLKKRLINKIKEGRK